MDTPLSPAHTRHPAPPSAQILAHHSYPNQTTECLEKGDDGISNAKMQATAPPLPKMPSSGLSHPLPIPNFSSWHSPSAIRPHTQLISSFIFLPCPASCPLSTMHQQKHKMHPRWWEHKGAVPLTAHSEGEEDARYPKVDIRIHFLFQHHYISCVHTGGEIGFST